MAPTIGMLPTFLEPIRIDLLQGPQFGLESSRGLMGLVHQLFPQGIIHTVRVEDLNYSEALPQKTLLVLPGAADIKTWNIPEKEQKKIEDLCKQGTLKVLGVCAGAFYVSKEIVYKGEKKVHAGRSIQLFQGQCVGPFSTHHPSSQLSITVEKIVVNQQQLDVTVNGGGWFVPSSELKEGKDYVVLANYDNQKQDIAAVACVPGSVESDYNAVLIGPHLEYEQHHFQALAECCSQNPLAKDQVQVMDHMGMQIEASRVGRVHAMHFFLSKLGFK